MRYVVLYVDGNKCLIGNYSELKYLCSVYLINESGLELAPRRMSKAEIEKTLGYKIEIIEDDEYDE